VFLCLCSFGFVESAYFLGSYAVASAKAADADVAAAAAHVCVCVCGVERRSCVDI